MPRGGILPENAHNPFNQGGMRTEFIECADYRTAYRRAPWASRVAKVCGGFMAFESVDDYETWKRQK